jgi:hypothetical protein
LCTPPSSSLNCSSASPPLLYSSWTPQLPYPALFCLLRLQLFLVKLG